MPYRLNTELLRTIAGTHGDHNDTAIREDTGISLGSFSRLVNGHVEPSIRHLDALSTKYDIPVGDLYRYVDSIPASAAA